MEQTHLDLLLAFSYLAVKHTLADFFLQTPYQYLNKGRYGHMGGILHALIHCVLTLPVYILLAPSGPLLAAIIFIGEFILHYHIDWLKEQFLRWRNLDQTKPAFWYALGLDQLAHTATYIAILALILSY